jgi:hypothetical protein
MVAAKFRFAKKSVALNARDARYKLRVYTLRVGAMAEAPATSSDYFSNPP